MKPYWIKTNSIIKKIFPKYIWDMPNNDKKVYLTFDDGPTPEITNWVLDELEKHNAKATFFCIGNNIQNHPEIYHKLKEKGHSTGNHTFNHLNGWKTPTRNYIQNTILSEKSKANLFRPPYGKIKPSQSKSLRKLGYKIIMWDVLSADFDISITPEKCLDNVLSNLTSGSIIVFHDSQKAFKNLEYALPRTLKFLHQHNYICEAL